MHVLFLTSNTEFLQPGGGKEHLYLQGLLDASETLHIIVATPWNSRYQRQKLRDNAWIYPTNALPGLQFFKILRTARFELYWQKEFRAHIIHSDDTYLNGWAGLALSWLYDRVWVVNLRTYESAFRFNAVPAWLLFWLSYRICIFSDTTRLYLLSRLQPAWEKKIVLFPRTVDVDVIGEEPAVIDVKKVYPPLNFVALTITKLGRGRDLRIALATLKILRANIAYSKAGMVIIGSGVAVFIARMRARFEGLSQWVHVERPTPELTSYLKTANIFLYLSSGKETEDMLIRAAASHCPIIAVDDVLSRAVIQDGINGSIIPRYPTPGEVATLILKINQGDERERFRINSSMNLKQTVIATPQEIVAAFKNIWEYTVAPEEPPKETTGAPYVEPHPLEKPAPVGIERTVEEVKETWKEMFPADK
jgi:glycosyltransferase involved in cell wall biosynthesis